VLVVEFGYKQGGGTLGTHEEEERPFQRLEPGPGQVVDAVERGYDEQIEPGLPDSGLKGF
jgi:hypothetical protein